MQTVAQPKSEIADLSAATSGLACLGGVGLAIYLVGALFVLGMVTLEPPPPSSEIKPVSTPRIFP